MTIQLLFFLGTALMKDPRQAMIHKLLPLLCLRLCAGQGDIKRDESLPRPSLQAWPSSVVPADSDVRLLCSAPTREADFALRKNNVLLESSPSPGSPEGLAEFHLTDVKSSSAGQYTCEYYSRERPNVRSLPSDALLLLVTGYLPKPSLQAHRRGKVTAGENVILQCQKPESLMESNMFALLKKGTSTPVRLQSPAGTVTDFFLRSVTVSDTGDYSCVYYLTRAPFWASEPSDSLTIWVTESPRAPSTDYTTGNLIRLGLSAVILVLTAAFLAEAWWSQRRPPRGSSSEDPIVTEGEKQAPQLPRNQYVTDPTRPAES